MQGVLTGELPRPPEGVLGPRRGAQNGVRRAPALSQAPEWGVVTEYRVDRAVGWGFKGKKPCYCTHTPFLALPQV